ncbi:unnamed protein product [Soboliphyme baturini]|uniref:Uncharacterized protein n=1 Tax=Soboliphyme baturini TaxID=241478 RepID=A0A183ITN7_9BILA|nr:unnamed protein product [Soboliphyme baturini]
MPSRDRGNLAIRLPPNGGNGHGTRSGGQRLASAPCSSDLTEAGTWRMTNVKFTKSGDRPTAPRRYAPPDGKSSNFSSGVQANLRVIELAGESGGQLRREVGRARLPAPELCAEVEDLNRFDPSVRLLCNERRPRPSIIRPNPISLPAPLANVERLHYT